MVDSVLWADWDPIGVNDNALARNEYSSYVPSVIRLVESGADAYKLAAHLQQLERASMGLSAAPERSRRVAQRILDEYQRMR